jgi:hypothetical protein
MRAILLILILVVVVLLIAIGTGFLDISQTRQAQAPQIATTGNGVTARGGQTPTFDVETGSVSVGTKQANVAVPSIQVNRPGGNQAANEVGQNSSE